MVISFCPSSAFVIISLWEDKVGRVAGRHFVCPYLVVSCFSFLLLLFLLVAEEGCCLYDTDHVVCHSFLQRDTAVKCTHYTLEKTLYQLEIINKGSDWP